jgi:sugar lactone lactonase YvrE
MNAPHPLTAEVLADGLLFPEAPRWREGRLYFSDFHGQRIAALDPATGGVSTVVKLDDAPSGLGWRADGVLQFVSMAERRLCALEDGAVRTVADLSAVCPGRTNDMVMTSAGAAYIGNFGYDMMAGAPAASTCLAFVEPTGRVRGVADDLMFPNGMVLIDDERTLVVAETGRSCLTAFDIAADGSLHSRRCFARFEPEVAPDGICADADGGLWVATARSGQCLRVGRAGQVTHAVQVSEGNITYACMLGGDDGRDLFICSAPSFRPAKTMALKRGRIERARAPFPHAGRP